MMLLSGVGLTAPRRTSLSRGRSVGTLLLALFPTLAEWRAAAEPE